MKKLSLAYFGSSSFSADFLEKIINDKSQPFEVKFVVTQPDKPVGRKQILTPTPVALIAKRYNINTNSGQAPLAQVDLALVYAFGEIIPAKLLNLPRFGFWNIHPSFLPKYRGPSPIAYPLILGEAETGVTIIKLDKQLDHGPIVAQAKLLIMSTDKRPDLEKKLTDLGFEMLKKEIKKLENGNLQLTDQNDKNATYTRLLTKQDGYVTIETLRKSMRNDPLTVEELPHIIRDYIKKNPKSKFQTSKQIIHNLFRGLKPWPGIWTMVNINNQQKRLKITDLELVNNKLVINKVQLEGKREAYFDQFNSFYKIF